MGLSAAVMGRTEGEVAPRSLGRSVLGYLWRVPACALAHVFGLMAAGAVAVVVGLKLPEIPGSGDQQREAPALLLSALVLAAALAPLAQRLRGRYVSRWLSLAVFAYVSLGVTGAIEASLFTRFAHMSSMAWLYLPPSVLCAAVAAALFGAAGDREAFGASLSRFFAQRSAGSWAWRLGVALLAFLVIYYFCGAVLMAVCPWALDFYKQEAAGLALPPFSRVVPVELLRSAMFLLTALPLLAMWTGSRRGLVVTLGLASWVLVGLYGMLQAFWLPGPLRVAHSVEILADSIGYAWALTALLVPPARPAAGAATEEAAV